MTDQQIIEAMKACTSLDADGVLNPDCDNCPYVDDEWRNEGFSACYDFSDFAVEVPWQLAHDLIEIAEKAPKWHIFHKRELTEAEKQKHPDWEWIMATDLTPCDGDRILFWDSYDGIRTETWSDDLFAEYCQTEDGTQINEGDAWMELPEPPYADMKGCEE